MKKVIFRYKFWLILTVCMKLIFGWVMVEVPLSIQRMINAVDAGEFEKFKSYFVQTIICFVIVAIVEYINRVTQAKYMQLTISYLKQVTFAGIVNKEHGDFFNNNTSEYISTLTNDITLFDKNYLGPFLEILGHIVVIGRSVVVLFTINPIIAGVLLGMSVLVLSLPNWFGKRLESKQEKFSQGLADYTARIKDVFLGYGVIEAYNMRKRIIAQHFSYNSDTQKREFRAIEAISEVAALSTLLCISTEVMAVGIGGFLTFKGIVLIGDLFAIIKLNDYLVGPMEDIANKYTTIRSMKEIVNKLKGYINEGQKAERGTKSFEFNDSISFVNVNFSYASNQPSILNDFNLKFYKGKKYAIVGTSGSGKSTVIRLLLRYYDTNLGAIKVDRTRINEISKVSLYSHVGVIHQEIYMFDQTLKENIVLGREYKPEDMQRVLRESGVDTFLPLLDNGIDTNLHENGSRLSGGQRQRVAIARALLEKKDILLLDEATSALDAKNYLEIENTVLAIPDMTIISVTHRLTQEVLSKYDEIIVMDRGRVVEQGGFDELINEKGFFYDLFNNNFASVN